MTAPAPNPDRLTAHGMGADGDYSIADMATQPWANYLESHGFDSAAFPHLVEWRARIAARPAVGRALARAQAAFTGPGERTRKSASLADLDRFFGRTDAVPAADFTQIRDA